MTSTPHDSLFKVAFGPPEHAAGILRKILPKAVVQAIRWDSLRLESGNFVDANLAKRHCDLLFSANLREYRINIYVLFEHQSDSVDDMPLRMSNYLGRVWARLKEQSPKKRLPLVLPVVLSHDPRGWRGTTHFWEMFEPNPADVPELAGFVPSFTFMLEDVSLRSDADIRAMALPPFPTLSIWLMRDARTSAQLAASLENWAQDLVQLLSASRGEEILEQLLTYIESVTEELDLKAIRGKMAEVHPRIEEIAVTIAEQMQDKGLKRGIKIGHKQGLEEGLEQGLEQGRHRTLVNTLRKLLDLRFDHGPSAEQNSAILAGTPQQLERWIERVLTAPTIDHVLSDE